MFNTTIFICEYVYERSSYLVNFGFHPVSPQKFNI